MTDIDREWWDCSNNRDSRRYSIQQLKRHLRSNIFICFSSVAFIYLRRLQKVEDKRELKYRATDWFERCDSNSRAGIVSVLFHCGRRFLSFALFRSKVSTAIFAMQSANTIIVEGFSSKFSITHAIRVCNESVTERK